PPGARPPRGPALAAGVVRERRLVLGRPDPAGDAAGTPCGRAGRPPRRPRGGPDRAASRRGSGAADVPVARARRRRDLPDGPGGRRPTTSGGSLIGQPLRPAASGSRFGHPLRAPVRRESERSTQGSPAHSTAPARFAAEPCTVIVGT